MKSFSYEVQIKVLLVGDFEQKKKFIQSIREPSWPEFDFISYSFEEYSGISLWHLIGSQAKLAISVHKDADAIIYLYPSENILNLYESHRNHDTCIALDFSEIKLTPKQCLEKIKSFVLREDMLEQEKNSMMQNDMQKSMMVLAANKKELNPHSIFNNLPKEIGQLIADKVHLCINPARIGFFAVPLKPVEEPQVKTELDCILQ